MYIRLLSPAFVTFPTVGERIIGNLRNADLSDIGSTGQLHEKSMWQIGKMREKRPTSEPRPDPAGAERLQNYNHPPAGLQRLKDRTSDLFPTEARAARGGRGSVAWLAVMGKPSETPTTSTARRRFRPD